MGFLKTLARVREERQDPSGIGGEPRTVPPIAAGFNLPALQFRVPISDPYGSENKVALGPS